MTSSRIEEAATGSPCICQLMNRTSHLHLTEEVSSASASITKELRIMVWTPTMSNKTKLCN